jgi:hypothetical protein
MRRRTRSRHPATDEPVSIAPPDLAEYVDAHGAAKLLRASISQVYALGRSGDLTPFLMGESPAGAATEVSGPHPWLLAEQHRLAEQSGWRWIPSIKQRPKRRALPKPPRRARLCFQRQDVIALKAKRQRENRQIAARRARVRVLGRDVSWPKVQKIRRMRVCRPRARVAPDAARQIPAQDPAIGRTAKLLSWAAPPPPSKLEISMPSRTKPLPPSWPNARAR